MYNSKMTDQSVQLNFLSRSDGSALYSLGNSVVLATVNGPTTSRHTNRIHNKCSLELQFYPSTGKPMVGERAVEGLITKCVRQSLAAHLHPQASVILSIQELQSEYPQQLLSACINAACLALLDAGVQLRSMLAAVTCCYTALGVILVEPGHFDAQEGVCTLTFVFESCDLAVVASEQQGSLTPSQYTACANTAKDAAGLIFAFYRSEIAKRYDTALQTKLTDSEIKNDNFEPV